MESEMIYSSTDLRPAITAKQRELQVRVKRHEGQEQLQEWDEKDGEKAQNDE